MPELRLPVRRGRRRVVLWLVVGLGLLIFFISPLVGLLAEWPWFSALGYQRVFATRLVASFTLGVLAGGVAFAFLYANLRFAQRGIVPNPVVMPASAQTPAVDVTRLVRRLALPAALAFALFLALAVSTDLMPVLQFLHQTPFGVTDPVFGRDLAYYVFTLPIVTGVLAILTVLVTLSLLACGALYALRGDVVFYRRTVTIEPSARLHLALLIAAMFVLTALRIFFVRLPGTLYSTTGPLFGASFADLHGRLIGLRIAGVAAILGTVLVLAALRSKRPGRTALLAVASYFGVSLLGVVVYPAIVQKVVVAPNELSKETPQLRRHIDATRRAWGLDSVLVRDLSGEARLTERDIQANRPTIDNVRLWDRDPLLQTFGQLQEIRTYYDFVSVDDDRYVVDGRYRQVMLSPRELNSASLPTRTFINERLTFTHGMGLTLGPVNEVTEEGLPVLFIKDLPPASTVSVAVRRPEIYFGERPDPFLRHMVMRLPEERQAEFILMVPFTPRGKDNLASWMVARNDGEHYGELVVYRFPKQSLVFGPTQIVNRINQDTEIARQIALWDQGGSQVIRGNLLVIPIEESLIYVMPLYLRAQGGRIPELKRVVVAYQNRVVMEETLDAGLAQLFGGGAGAAREPARVAATPGAAPATNARAADLARRANESYRRALEAQRAGDWARYGEELRRLEDLLRQLQTVLGGRE